MKKAQCTMCNLYIRSLGAPTFIVWYMISNIIKFLCVKKYWRKKCGSQFAISSVL